MHKYNVTTEEVNSKLLLVPGNKGKGRVELGGRVGQLRGISKLQNNVRKNLTSDEINDKIC